MQEHLHRFGLSHVSMAVLFACVLWFCGVVVVSTCIVRLLFVGGLFDEDFPVESERLVLVLGVKLVGFSMICILFLCVNCRKSATFAYI